MSLTEPAESAVRAVNLSRRFEMGETIVEALCGINLDVRKEQLQWERD